MDQTNPSALVALLAGAVLLGGPWAGAQEDQIETVVVTGSRISYSPTDGPQPLTVVTREDIEDSGLLSVGDLIQRLPMQGSGINRTYNNGGDGSVRVELRALGAARTLVLVNGKRWVASGEGANSSIDLNTIPMAAIERVEVLKDGASAVYGSDAIAGVVNIILRKNFEGIEFSHQTGDFGASGGGGEQTWSVLGGGAADRARFTIGASLTTVDDLSNADRTQTAARPSDGGSSGTPQGRFGYAGVVGGFGNFTLREGEAGTDPSHFREWTSPDDRFNYNPDNYIQTPSERRNIFMNGSYELTDQISFLFDALYQNRLSDQLLAPTPLFWGFSADEGIDATNIHNPFGTTFCGFSGTNNLGADCSTPRRTRCLRLVRSAHGGSRQPQLPPGHRDLPWRIRGRRSARRPLGLGGLLVVGAEQGHDHHGGPPEYRRHPQGPRARGRLHRRLRASQHLRWPRHGCGVPGRRSLGAGQGRSRQRCSTTSASPPTTPAATT